LDAEQLTKLLMFGIQRGVSDIHFAVGHRPHYRVKGDLLAAKYAPMTPEDTVDIARILLDEPDWDPRTLVRERDTSYSIAGVGRFRVHVFCQRGSVGIVIRAIPYEVRSYEALNLPKVLPDIFSARRGLILVTGATGMGKSTTIAAMIKHINETRNAHVVTIEDPIEFLYAHGKCIITQREVGSDTASYRDALVAALRQDPDVIMVGEVRDVETLEAAFQAALTGHLVLTSMHANDAPAAATRMLQMGTEPYLVSSALRAVLAQRLARRVCPDCKVSVSVEDALEESPALLKRLKEHRITVVAEGEGCERCRQTGFHGRVGLFELMRMTPQLKEMVLGDVDEQAMRHAAVSEGMVQLASDAMAKLRSGIIGVEALLSLYADLSTEYGDEAIDFVGMT